MREWIRILGALTLLKDLGKWQNGPVKLVFSRLYTRNGEYIYVEYGEIERLRLARILIIKGAKNVVMPYSDLVVEKG